MGDFSINELLKIEAPRIPRGASVVVITPSVEPSVLATLHELKRSGLSPVLVILDSLSFGGIEGGRRIANASHAEGIPVRFVSYGDSLTEALSKRALPLAFDTIAA